jgi:hypothetical protein
MARQTNAVAPATGRQYIGPTTGGVVAVGNTPGTQILHNYIHDVASFGIRAGATNNVAGDWNYSNTTVQGNVIIHIGTNDQDIGAIGVIDIANFTSTPASTNVLIDPNYIRDYASPTGYGFAIYLDEGSSNTTVSNNIVTGAHVPGYGAYAVLLDDGNNDLIKNNIFDLEDTNLLFVLVNAIGAGATPSTRGLNVAFKNNIVLSNAATIPAVDLRSSGNFAFNFYDNASFGGYPIGVPTFTGNYYINYHAIGSGPWYNSSGNNFTDTSATQASSDPGISCWLYNVASGSPIRTLPSISFPSLCHSDRLDL